MARPIETAVECRQELVALSKTFEQAGWKFKIESSFPRWRDRTEQRLGAAVSLKASTEFARLQRKPRQLQNETWVDVVAMHLAFLEELVHDVQIHPEEYGPSVIAHERRVNTAARERSNPKSRKEPLTAPGPVSLAWLFRHLSVTIVAIYAGSVLLAFALGVVVGRGSVSGRVVERVQGAVVDTAKAPAAAPR
jgi:hypothetical protein